MKILTSFEQGSPEWKQARAGKVTASRAKDARDRLKSGAASGKQISYACQVALERVSHQPADATFENWQMREGHIQEPIARAAYEQRTGNLVDEVGAFATDDDLFLYSPDGLIDGDGLLEVKTLFSPERIMTIVGNGDVSDFIDQCMFGLWLTGRQWIDLVVWVPSLEHLTIKRIGRDEDYIEAMETDLMAFSRLVTQYENTLRAAIQSTNEPALEAA
ncbi:MAG TPA: YqaJ viral recombinase family protein [Thiobacillus sp.]|uniref:lambda exonuclease family protein n=1 Tax=Acidovorax sp. TaxID=1872122 RepID=UPI00260DCBFC|nr:lambda exonuclease family protein [Acidovorax sp.]HQS64823.1 YqaJ viral recombinase family protein [Acidovorax defluvii]HQT19521.1 YqaJ viral recombinase family protein [Acidovorax defluvii]HQT72141.1 YqaJ viral recombinase family protein [Thiobacillus sp.]